MPDRIDLGGPRALRPIAPETPRTGYARSNTAAPAAARSGVERSDALNAGPPPVDSDRVAEVRRAIERGEYPITPTKVADAMIAAGILLRTGR